MDKMVRRRWCNSRALPCALSTPLFRQSFQAVHCLSAWHRDPGVQVLLDPADEIQHHVVSPSTRASARDTASHENSIASTTVIRSAMAIALEPRINLPWMVYGMCHGKTFGFSKELANHNFSRYVCLFQITSHAPMTQGAIHLRQAPSITNIALKIPLEKMLHILPQEGLRSRC